jgi:hypothetical protein
MMAGRGIAARKTGSVRDTRTYRLVSVAHCNAIDF